MVLVCFIFVQAVFTQNKETEITFGKDYPLTGKDKISPVATEVASSELTALNNSLKQAKQSGDNSRVLEIQKQIDALTGQSITVESGISTYNGRYLGDQVLGDNIINDRIFVNPAGTTIKATAQTIEQRGSNIGRIWLVVAYGTGNTSTPDTVRVFNSNDGGVTWNSNSFFIPAGFSKINSDQLDIEMMEYNSGEKYLWLTFGRTDNASKQLIDIIVIQTPTFAFGGFTLNWPGGATNNNMYMPRLTSDNSNYPTGSSWLFLIAARDTVLSTGVHKICEKFMKCTSPFSITPTFTYKSSALSFDLNYGGVGNYYANANHCDIAYFRNGGADSLVMLESNVPDTTKIYLYKSDENPDGNNPVNFATLDGGDATSKHKQFVRVICNGTNRIMIAYRSNFNNTGDWDIRYAVSTNGGITASAWSNGYIDGFASTVTYPFQPDLAGLRGTSSFKCSYVYFNSGIDSSMLSSAPNGTWTAPLRVSIAGTDVSVSASSHAGYRFANGDSCLTIWSGYPGTNVWSARGCSGAVVTGINNHNNEIPSKYSLSQNYPNPFNPVTMISFSIPVSGNVKLVIYDMLGKEIAVLSNEFRSAGNYDVDFNASGLSSGAYFYKLESGSFSEIKKMVLIK
jgi:hypothetical protein